LAAALFTLAVNPPASMASPEGSAATAASICDSVTQIPAVECEALVALYNATGGSTHWLDDDGWLQTTTPCSWFGVDCSGGHVTSLDLFNRLNGPIPPQLGDLTELQTLILAPDLTGPIPAELGNLVDLQVLQLRGDLAGGIPPELGNLVDLRVLRL